MFVADFVMTVPAARARPASLLLLRLNRYERLQRLHPYRPRSALSAAVSTVAAGGSAASLVRPSAAVLVCEHPDRVQRVRRLQELCGAWIDVVVRSRHDPLLNP